MLLLLTLLFACGSDLKTGSDSESPDGEDPEGGDTGEETDVVATELRSEGWMLLINEIFVYAEDGGANDWVELYNAGTEMIDLTDIVLETNSGDADDDAPLASFERLAPGEFLVAETCEEDDCLDFGLNGSGETVSVCDGDCTNGDADRVTYGSGAAGNATEGLTVSRETDGGDTWVYAAATPGASNQ